MRRSDGAGAPVLQAEAIGLVTRTVDDDALAGEGAIALGHPLGASGTKLIATLVHALKERGGRYGLQTMCEGSGIANVTIIERL